MNEPRDVHRLPTGTWVIHRPKCPWTARGHRCVPARYTDDTETIPGGSQAANSCEEERKSMAKQVGPACHEPEPALGPFEAVWELRRGVRGFHQGPGTEVPTIEAGYKCATEPACPYQLLPCNCGADHTSAGFLARARRGVAPEVCAGRDARAPRRPCAQEGAPASAGRGAGRAGSARTPPASRRCAGGGCAPSCRRSRTRRRSRGRTSRGGRPSRSPSRAG